MSIYWWVFALYKRRIYSCLNFAFVDLYLNGLPPNNGDNQSDSRKEGSHFYTLDRWI